MDWPLNSDKYLCVPPSDVDKYKYIISRTRYTNIRGAMDIYVYEEANEFENCFIYYTIYQFTWYFISVKHAQRQLDHAINMLGKRCEARCTLWTKECTDFYQRITFTLFPS